MQKTLILGIRKRQEDLFFNMTVEHFIKKMAEEKWTPNGGWTAEQLNGVPPGNYDVEFKDHLDKVIMVKGSTMMSASHESFPEWIKETNKQAYKSNFIQIF